MKTGLLLADHGDDTRTCGNPECGRPYPYIQGISGYERTCSMRCGYLLFGIPVRDTF